MCIRDRDLAHDMGIVGGVDKIDVVGPLADQFQADLTQAGDGEAVSYTHLDAYKRQPLTRSGMSG